MSLPRNLLLLGKVRPERKRSMNGMAAAAKLSLVAIEEPAEALAWLEDNAIACLVVDAAVARLDKIVAKVRSKAQLSHVPVFAFVQSPDDLWVEQYFSWGGDDIVSVDAGASLLERLKSVSVEGPKPSPWRGVVVADPDPTRCAVLARAFAQAGSTVTTVTERSRLEQIVKEQAPTVVVANAALGGLSDVIMKLRRDRNRSGWVVMAARRDFEAQQAALQPLERCVVMGIQSSPWQILYQGNVVARAAAGAEHRNDTRYYVGNSVLFRAAGGDEDEMGVCYNLSSSGMFVRTFAPLVANQVWIEWRIPGDKTRVRLEGEVVWRQVSMADPSRPSSPLGFGVRFGDYLGAAKNHLERALEALENTGKKSASSPPAPSASSFVSGVAKSVVTPPVLGKPVVVPPVVGKPVAPTPVAPKLAGPTALSGKTGRSASLPPRPAGFAVAAPQRPEKPVDAETSPLRSTSKLAAEPPLEEVEAPNSSELTEIVKNPLLVFEQEEALPDFSLPDESLAELPLSEVSTDDAPTVVTQAPSEFLLGAVAREEPTTTRHNPVPDPTGPQPPTSWDEAERALSRRRGPFGTVLALVGLVVVVGGVAMVLLREKPNASTKNEAASPSVAATAVAAPQEAAATAASSAADAKTNTPETPLATVTPDPGGDLPGYPAIEESQAGKGRLLADRYGYLVVRFPEPAFIFSDAIAIGPVNSKLATTCGQKSLRIGVGEKPTTYLSDLGQVTVACRETTRVVFRRLPGVVAPPGALRPIPVGMGSSEVKAKTDGDPARAPEKATATTGSDPGSAGKAQEKPVTTAPAEKAAKPDEGVVDSRE